jgi:hypothetical protein
VKGFRKLIKGMYRELVKKIYLGTPDWGIRMDWAFADLSIVIRICIKSTMLLF